VKVDQLAYKCPMSVMCAHLNTFLSVCYRELEAELVDLERRGPLQSRPDWGPGEKGRWCRACVFCQVELGLLMNKGVVCRDCRCRVCKTCRVRNDRSTTWLCPTCNKRR
jgi:hypothetical protein